MLANTAVPFCEPHEAEDIRTRERKASILFAGTSEEGWVEDAAD